MTDTTHRVINAVIYAALGLALWAGIGFAFFKLIWG